MKDAVIPNGKWCFDDNVTAVFDDMLSRSIPQYQTMREMCFQLACQFQQAGTEIVDLGCSRGEAMRPLVERFKFNNRFVGIEISRAMLAAARARFSEQIAAGMVEIHDHDLREAGLPIADNSASVIMSVLCVMFVPIEYRQRLLKEVYDAISPGGALILVEKVLGDTARIDDVMRGEYYAMKEANGYTQEQIDRKRLALEGVLVPVTARMNEEFLRGAGFHEIDCFWRWHNFAGWVAIK